MAGPTGLPLLGYEGWPDACLDLVVNEVFATLIVMFLDAAYCLPVLKRSRNADPRSCGLWAYTERRAIALAFDCADPYAPDWRSLGT